MTAQPNATRTLYGGHTRSRDRRTWRRDRYAPGARVWGFRAVECVPDRPCKVVDAWLVTGVR